MTWAHIWSLVCSTVFIEMSWAHICGLVCSNVFIEIYWTHYWLLVCRRCLYRKRTKKCLANKKGGWCVVGSSRGILPGWAGPSLEILTNDDSLEFCGENLGALLHCNTS